MMKQIRVLLLALSVAVASCASSQEEVRNVIYLIGDGMGLAQVSLLEIEEGYRPTAFSEAETVALVTTRSANNRVTDSAAAGTALATGTKIINSALGITPDSVELTTMMELARDRGMATGLVVTCYLQHATPASFYANVPHRGQNDRITEQLVACDFDVLIGGGAQWLNDEQWQTIAEKGYTIARTEEEVLRAEDPRLFAVLADKSLDRAPERGDYLPKATKKALELLSQKKEGFMLMVEGSQIDGAGHARDAAYLLAEMQDFERTIRVALDFADEHPGTLVVVTADHETGGLSLPSGKSDFTLSESGIDYRFGTNSHSAIRVPAFFYGAGADRFGGMIDNTELAKQIMETLHLNQ